MAKKKKNLKPAVLDTTFFVGGVVIGELIAHLVRNISFLKWLSFQVSGTLDLVLVSISVNLNPAVVIFPLLFVVGGRLLKRMLAEQKQRRFESDEDDFDND
ncbi:MAG: hypothetical protein ACI3YH_08115 [Eubacteriales bacterium]